ncbi:MAG TPA: CHAT domain-containing tetratricopeptide repeat protein, partial [Pyrinomonadaceae bacterium]|nr:CHAT domain-containing tetratricopeptide repeat protein [Pyrinomonadaceae bacterium]
IGFVYSTLGDWQKSLDYFNQALLLQKNIDDRRWGEATTLTSIGIAYTNLGALQPALDHLNQALQLHRAVGNRAWEVTTLNQLGVVYRSLGQTDKALEYFNSALPLSRTLGNRNVDANILLNIARSERARNNLTAARERTEAAIAITESLRTQIVNQDLRATYLASKREYYEFYIDLLMKLDQDEPAGGHGAEALQASERAQARNLLETLTEARIDIRQGVDPPLLTEERNLQQRINETELRRVRLLSGKPTTTQTQAIESELSSLLTAYSDLQAQIRLRSPRYAALTLPVPLNLRDIQAQVLDDDTILLEYSLGETRSYLWVVTRTQLKSFVLPKRAVVEATARHVYESFIDSHKTEGRRASELAAMELSRMVLAPAAELLDKKRLLVVGDGALQFVPFAALAVPSDQTRTYKPLISRFEVISLPSASVLALIRKENADRQPAPQAVAVLADAVFQRNDSRFNQGHLKAHLDPTPSGEGLPRDLLRSAEEFGLLNFPRLPFSRQEAEDIVAQAGANRSFKALDFAASRETVFNENIRRYRIVHFATHGLLNSQHPELSGVVLSLFDEQGRPIDGFLRAHETYNLKLNADLVVLSGCRTALGKQIRGEGLVGLTRGFMYAGAKSVVASLWDVRDEATSELMRRFYEKMFKDGLRPAAALRAAQVSMWSEKRWEPPYHWAGFVLQGEWK